MALKTHQTEDSVEDFINKIHDKGRREDCQTINLLFQKITGTSGKMWGTSIVGYGSYTYTRSDKKSYEYLAIGFSPRATSLTIYSIPGYTTHPELMAKLGTYSTGKSCLYVKSLSDIDLSILEKILNDSFLSISGKHLDYASGQWT